MGQLGALHGAIALALERKEYRPSMTIERLSMA
jgi:hypothetical protein